MKPNLFKYSTLALSVALSLHAYADPVNPHQNIGLTDEMMSKYTGKGIKIGIVDGGFILEHRQLRDQANIHPLTFTLLNPFSNKEDIFDATAYLTAERLDPETGGKVIGWQNHGGAVLGAIKAKPIEIRVTETEAIQYKGGIARDTEVYLTNIEAEKPSALAPNDSYGKIISNMKPGTTYLMDRYAAALNKVMENKPFVVNISSNGDPESENIQTLDNTFRPAIARLENSNKLLLAIKNAVNQGTLMVFAAGNESKTQPGIYSSLPRYIPSLENYFLSVAAIEDDRTLAPYSNHCGYNQNWCVVAPGSYLNPDMVGYPDHKFDAPTSLSGTSFAAPLVSGSLALLKERFNYFTPTQVRDTLLTTTTDLGESGVDSKFGWGLVNLEQGVKGPMQLLKDETYTVTQDDQWDNPLNANNHSFKKSGSNTLALNGVNRLAEVVVEQGNLVLNGDTQATRFQNNAELTLNTRSNTPITASNNSTTRIGANGHWVMQNDTTLGNVEMQEGAQITLNPRHSAAGAGQTRSADSGFNTLTINQNLSGKGIFNFLTRLQDFVGDKVLVNGIATGDFKLNVENSGIEPTSNDRLTLLELRHGAQDENAVNVSLVKPVDFGAYRYELLKADRNTYRLYNPKKEQELKAAEEAEAQRQKQAEEAEKQEQARRLAEAERLAAERQTQLEAERLAKETAQRELAEARSKLALETEKLQAAQQLAQTKTELAETTQAQLAVAQQAAAAAKLAEQTARTEQQAQTAAKQAAEKAQQLAEQAKTAAEGQRDTALAQAQAALADAEQKAEEARLATQRAETAERLKQLADESLNEANRQLTAQQQAVKIAEANAKQSADALAQQTTALAAAQTAREKAEQALNSANADKAKALADAEQAQALAAQKSQEAEQARNQVQQANQALAKISEELTASRQAQQALADEKAQLLAQKTDLEAAQNSTSADLLSARQRLREAEQALANRSQEAEQARLAQQTAEALAQQAEQAKAQALTDAQTALERQQKAENAQAEALAQAEQANQAKQLAEQQREQALADKTAAEQAKAIAEQRAEALAQANAQAKAAATQALSNERLARQQLAQAQQQLAIAQNGTAEDIKQAQTDLARAQQQLVEKTAELNSARLAQRQAESDKANAELAIATAEQAKILAETAQRQAEQQASDALRRQADAEATSAQAQAEKIQAENAKQLAETRLAEAQLAVETARANEAKAQLTLAQANQDNQRLTQANQALEQALQREQTAKRQLEEANAVLASTQTGSAQDLNAAKLALAAAERLVAEKTSEVEQAQKLADSTRQALVQAEKETALAQENVRLAVLAQTAAENSKQQTEALLVQVNAKIAGLTEATNQAEIAKTNAELAATQAQAAQLRAEQAQAVAEQALAGERLARVQAETAKAALETALTQSNADLNQARTALANAEQALNLAQENAKAKTAEAEQAKQLAAQSELARTQAEQIARLAETAKAQAEADKATAEANATQAQAEKIDAETAKAQAEADKAAAEANAAQAQAEKIAAETAKAQAEADKATAEANAAQAQAEKIDAETAKAQAEADKAIAEANAAQAQAEADKATAEADNVAAEKATAQQAQQAIEQRKQAELISRYSNTALSELSAQVNVLEQISHSLNNHLFDTNRNLSVWAEYNKQHSNQASDNYRRFEQESELKQVAVSVPFGQVEQVNIGVIASEVRSVGKFDDNANHHSTTKMISGFARLNVNDNVFAEVDLGGGSSRNEIELDGEKTEFKRNLATAGVRLGYSAEAFGLKVQPSVGLRYHHLGALNYRLAQAEIQSGQIDLAGLQAGIRVEKAWQLGNVTLAPYYSAQYSDMGQQTHDITVNDTSLTQQFGRHYRHEIGLNANYAEWHLNAKAGTISGNEAMKQRYAGVKLNYQW